MPNLIILLLPLLLMSTLSAADPVGRALATVDEANAARAALGAETAAWAAERERLQAIIEAIALERARLEQVATGAGAEADEHAAVLEDFDQASDLAAIRREIGSAAEILRDRLEILRAALPPGTVSAISAGGDGIDALDAVVAALGSAERAAGAVAIEIVSGQLDGTERAIKLLRVAAAAGWWLGLEGDIGGTARMLGGRLVLERSGDRQTVEAIQAAMAIVEGRAPPTLLVLPFVPLVEAAERAP